MSTFLFWLASGLIGYTYAGFPILVMLRARLRPRPHRVADVTPAVSVVIAAHDEERSIGARVDNLLGLDYPRDCLEVVIASDGSTDRTVAEARRDDPRVRVLDLPRTGKASALNAAVAEGGLVKELPSGSKEGRFRTCVRPVRKSPLVPFLPASGAEKLRTFCGLEQTFGGACRM